MAKKKTARKPSGAAAIETIDEVHDVENGRVEDDLASEIMAGDDEATETSSKAAKPARKSKPKAAKPASETNGHIGVAEIRKAAAFATAMGGLDRAISVLQILKVAREI